MGEARRRQHDDLMTNPRYVVAIVNNHPAPIEAYLLTPFLADHVCTPKEQDEIKAYLRHAVAETLSDPQFWISGTTAIRQAWGRETSVDQRRNCRTPEQFSNLAKTTNRRVLRAMLNNSEIDSIDWITRH
jgi:hypothetical protein